MSVRLAPARMFVVILIGLVVGTGISFGTMVREFKLSEVSKNATLVFAGTVSSSQSYRTPKTIRTKVTFNHLRFAKGTSKVHSLTLNLAGGALEDGGVVVDGQPSFTVGERYIVFAEDLGSEANSFMPIVGLHQGCFHVKGSAGNGLVVDSRGLFLADIGPDHVTAVYPDSLIPPDVRDQGKRVGAFNRDSKASHRYVLGSEDPGTRVTEEAFLQAVNQFPK